MMFGRRIVALPYGSNLNATFTQMIVRMVEAVVLNRFGIFVKKLLHQPCGSPCVISLELRLTEVPPNQIDLVVIQQDSKDVRKIVLVSVMMSELSLTFLLGLVVSCGIGYS